MRILGGEFLTHSPSTVVSFPRNLNEGLIKGMQDTLLTAADREEALSKAYAHSVAASAGYSTAVYDPDRDGVDIRIQAGGSMRPAIELQLKATINLRGPNDGFFRFPLKRRNYDLLRIETQTPRLLVVLDLPRDESQWMTITREELVLRRCAYWLDLRGQVERSNQDNITVYIPEGNLFDVLALTRLMEQSRRGRIQ